MKDFSFAATLTFRTYIFQPAIAISNQHLASGKVNIITQNLPAGIHIHNNQLAKDSP